MSDCCSVSLDFRVGVSGFFKPLEQRVADATIFTVIAGSAVEDGLCSLKRTRDVVNKNLSSVNVKPRQLAVQMLHLISSLARPIAARVVLAVLSMGVYMRMLRSHY
eukprot:CAMPEP_0119334880 /NCGR_PEP_ID=MMETSP1333-20130426/88256_1 /TAXON_ID=418940 /ORGANISM="Scyphosphaera apsteinii, Strain RCC1455" /LENGTH=105 /DNA_ID=CAMNT_0007345293 /DNA_START=27 /DNA_END=344 /DNA_ORIENTATION=+